MIKSLQTAFFANGNQLRKLGNRAVLKTLRVSLKATLRLLLCRKNYMLMESLEARKIVLFSAINIVGYRN